MQLRFLVRGLILSAIALCFVGTLAGLLGCSAGGEPMDAPALRQQFPAQADEVLRGRFAFAPSREGFEAGPSDAMESEPFGGGLRARLPERGDGALQFELPGGFQVRVREIGAGGTGAVAEDAVAYAREGGTSFWVATEAGYEEWLWIEAARVRRDAPIGVWEVEGAGLQQEGEAVLVVDERGTAQIRVTAPAAYAEGGRPIATRLAAEGARISLWVEAEAEAVLVDPGWIRLKHEMESARGAHTATLLQDGRVLVAGGGSGDGTEVLASAELFDLNSKTWVSTKGSMHDARQFHTATLLPDGRVLVAGGRDLNAVALASAELFDPVSQTWTSAGSMSDGRVHHTATLLADGRVLIAGGLGSAGHGLASAELFDPKTHTWVSTKGTMADARGSHAAMLLADGRVLVAGGHGDNGYLASAESFDPASETWTKAAPMSSARTGHTATRLSDGRVLVTGGKDSTYVLKTAEVFDPGSQTWTSVDAMRAPRRDHTATLLSDGRVLVAGNVDGTNTYLIAELFDPVSQTWTLAAFTTSVNILSSIAGRLYHTATLLTDGRVLIAGGLGDYGRGLASAELFDPAGHLWTFVRPMSDPRVNHTATLLQDGRVLVAGGVFYGKSAELFDPASRSWTPTAPMSSSRFRHTATLLPDGRVLVAGGSNLNGAPDSLASAELFDPTSKIWTPTAPMTTSRNRHTATLLPDGRVLVTGGLNFSSLASAELFDPASKTWTPTAPMSKSRVYHTATLLPDGHVLVTGGDDSAELFDPASGTWTPTAPMSTSRQDHTATLLEDGRVLVASGGGPISPELFDPASGTWTATAAMNTGRDDHTATLLEDGRVLVTGGVNGGSLASAEVFDPASGTWTSAAEMHEYRVDHTATLLPDGHVLVAGGESEEHTVLASAVLFDLVNPSGTGTACTTPLDCQSGFCADGVCCDQACLGGACVEYLDAPADGTCALLPHPECSPFVFSYITGVCSTFCQSLDECVPGFACDHSGKCIPIPPEATYLDDAGCHLAAPSGSAPATSRPVELAVVLLAASMLRRRRRRGGAPLR